MIYRVNFTNFKAAATPPNPTLPWSHYCKMIYCWVKKTYYFLYFISMGLVCEYVIKDGILNSRVTELFFFGCSVAMFGCEW